MTIAYFLPLHFESGTSAAVLYSASVNISRMYLHQGATLVLQSGTQANAYVVHGSEHFYSRTDVRRL